MSPLYLSFVPPSAGALVSGEVDLTQRVLQQVLAAKL